MSIKRKLIFAVGVLTIGLIMALPMPPAGRVSLVYRGVQRGHTVMFGFTNSTRRTITYNGTSREPELHWMTLTPQGWKRNEIIYMGTLDLPRPRTLAALQGIVFGVCPDDSLSKIAVNYSDGRSTNGVWRLLPRWITGRLPWLKDTHTLESPVFSLKGQHAGQ